MTAAHGAVTMKALTLAVAFLGSSLLGLSGCTSTSCTAEARSHSFSATRDVAVDAKKAKTLKVELCVEGRCSTATMDETGKIPTPGFSGELGITGGSLVAKDASSSTLSLQLAAYERGAETKTPVIIRVLDASGSKLHESSSEIRWSDDECHPSPESNQL